MDMSSRPVQPLPGMDAQLENSIYESSGENTYDSVYADVSERLSLSESLYNEIEESLYSEIEESLYAEIDEGQVQVPPPVPDSPRPSLRRTLENALYERSGSLYDNAEWINAENKWG